MKICLANLTEGQSYSRALKLSTTAENVDLLGATPIDGIDLKVDYFKSGERLYVTVKVDAKASGSCDLCGLPAVADCTCTLEEEYTTEDSSFNHKDNSFDITGLIEDCIALSRPREIRCSASCKGLCPTCGCNLNLKDCNCEKQSVGDNNPFGVLQDLLKGGALNGSTKKKNI